MEIKLNGIERVSFEDGEAIIFQNNFYGPVILFSYFTKNYKDEQKTFDDAIARFIVKPKNKITNEQ